MTHTLREIALIGAAIGEGAADVRCRAAPAVLKRWGLARRLAAHGLRAHWRAPVLSDLRLMERGPLAVVADFAPRLADAVGAALDDRALPVVIGGDHSCAIGTWSGVASALRTQGPLGLVWVDAHLDSHTPETSETQNPHGMPLAVLLGHGAPELVAISDPLPKLSPERLVLIGARSWETGEADLLRRLGVRVIDADETRRRGFADCLAEAVERAGQGAAGWGLSFDLDGLDPADAPGTGVPVANGIRLAEARRALTGLAARPGFCAFELVEYNPARDVARRTALAVEALLASLLGPATGRP